MTKRGLREQGIKLGIVAATVRKFVAYIFPIFYVILTGIFFEIWSINSVVDFNVPNLFNLIIGYSTKGYTVLLHDVDLSSVKVKGQLSTFSNSAADC